MTWGWEKGFKHTENGKRGKKHKIKFLPDEIKLFKFKKKLFYVV